MARSITFPKTGPGIWTNRETGIIIRLELDGSGYRPMRPTRLGSWIGISRPVPTLNEARSIARGYAFDSARFGLADAHTEALAENAARDQAARDQAASEAQDAGREMPLGATRRGVLGSLGRCGYWTPAGVWRVSEGASDARQTLDGLAR
jgi:hypothetical protein